MKLQFLAAESETPDISTFIFKPLDAFTWQAGQSVRLEIPGLYAPLEHRFSISSPPALGLVTFTTRRSESDYKTSLFALQPGTIAKAHGLEGDFTWRESGVAHIFIAAGIGVTPFHAMLAERKATQQPLNALLLYSGHDESLPFVRQFDQWAKEYPEFTVQYVLGRHIALADLPADAAARFLYISGPSKLVSTLHADLLGAGFARRLLLRDLFTGQLPHDE